MTKLVFCCRRQANLTVEEFQSYWLHNHAALVRSLRKAIPQMTRYVQSHTLYGPATDAVRASRGTDEPYDGVTEVWLDDDAKPEATPASIEAGLKLLQDELTFLDMARSSVFLTVEHVIFD
jgi:EthD domain